MVAVKGMIKLNTAESNMLKFDALRYKCHHKYKLSLIIHRMFLLINRENLQSSRVSVRI